MRCRQSTQTMRLRQVSQFPSAMNWRKGATAGGKVRRSSCDGSCSNPKCISGTNGRKPTPRPPFATLSWDRRTRPAVVTLSPLRVRALVSSLCRKGVSGRVNPSHLEITTAGQTPRSLPINLNLNHFTPRSRCRVLTNSKLAQGRKNGSKVHRSS